jgi:hypothetical protein
MCTAAMDAVDVLDSDHRALASVGWKPGNAGHLHRMERMDQPIDQSAMHRIREQRLGALMARLAQRDQAALAELYMVGAEPGAVVPTKPTPWYIVWHCAPCATSTQHRT